MSDLIRAAERLEELDEGAPGQDLLAKLFRVMDKRGPVADSPFERALALMVQAVLEPPKYRACPDCGPSHLIRNQ